MEFTGEKLRKRIENERTFLEHLANEDLHSEKTMEQSRFVDELIAQFYGACILEGGHSVSGTL